MHSLLLSNYNQRKKAMLHTENWFNRLNCRMELGPWHLPISCKMHSPQPCLSLGSFNYIQVWAQVMRMKPSRLMSECQGNDSSVMTPLPQPVFVGAPREKPNLLVELVLLASTRTAVAPFERVQLLMQSQNSMIQSGRLSQPYKGIFNCFARTIRNEGVISLWRGNAARVMGLSVIKAFSFASASYVESRNGHWDYGGILALGGLVAATLFVPYSLTYAGIRLANDIKASSKVGKWQFNGILDVYIKTLKSDGIAGLYCGYNMSFIRDAMNHIVIRGLSAALERGKLLQLLGLQNNLLGRVILPLGFAVCCIVAAYPMDTVNKRMMMTSGEAIKYKNSSDAFLQIFKNEGLKSFYKGGGADILRFAAICMFMIHLPEASSVTMRWMNGKREQM